MKTEADRIVAEARAAITNGRKEIREIEKRIQRMELVVRMFVGDEQPRASRKRTAPRHDVMSDLLDTGWTGTGQELADRLGFELGTTSSWLSRQFKDGAVIRSGPRPYVYRRPDESKLFELPSGAAA